MLKNWFKVAYRNLIRNKVFSIINISGLAFGMAACILISLYILDELSYDRYHEHADRIYRVSREFLNDDGVTNLHLGQVAPPFGPLLDGDFEGIIEYTVRMLPSGGSLISYEDIHLEQEGVFFAEPALFDIFSFEVLKGDKNTMLTEPNSVVISESFAEIYFKGTDPVGKTMRYDDMLDVKVTGVTKDIPRNSHFHFDCLISFVTVENFFGRENMMGNWGSNNYATYILLKEGYDPKELEGEFPEFLNRHIQSDDSDLKASDWTRLNLWPLESIHLHSHLDTELETNGNITFVIIYGAIALFILLIACINFMNLSTARSLKRSKEVGLRKVVGAHRFNIFNQFIAESVTYSLLAVIVALIIAALVLPYFNNFIEKDLALALLVQPKQLIVFILIVLLSGLIAGSYPAVYLSSFHPVKVIKGSLTDKKSALSFRHLLVVFQFLISIILIIGVGVINDQIEYVKSKELGFERENILVLPTSDEIYDKYELVKSRLLDHTGITKVAMSSRVPSGRLLDSNSTEAEVNGELKSIPFRVADIHVDHDFLNVLGANILAGRNFDDQLASDSVGAYILNATAVREIGWSNAEDAIDREFHYGNTSGRVIGVVQDFHFESLHQEIAPMIFLITSGRRRSVMVKFLDTEKNEVFEFLKEQWATLRPNYPFTYYYVSENFDEQYNSEDRLGKLIQYFSGLAILIAVLGLFGLVSYSTEQRTKEIGIRKVMGASVTDILLLLNTSYLRLVVIAIVISIPVAWWGMTKWLSTFAYHTNVQMVTILVSGIVAFLIATVTVSYRTWRSANTNPAVTLKYE
jgi:putative ABC transport system permease protein